MDVTDVILHQHNEQRRMWFESRKAAEGVPPGDKDPQDYLGQHYP